MMDYEIKERFYLYQIQHCQSRLAFLLLFKIPGLSNTPTDNVPRASILGALPVDGNRNAF